MPSALRTATDRQRCVLVCAVTEAKDSPSITARAAISPRHAEQRQHAHKADR